MRPRVQWLVTAILGILAVLSVVAAVLVAVSHEDPVLIAPRGEPATTSVEPEQEDLPRIGNQNLLTQGPSTTPALLLGRPMYNACALLPESEIAAMGLRIHTFVQANSDHLSRDVADPQLTGAVSDASTCIYYIESPTGPAAPESGDSVGEVAGILHLSVEQAPFTDDGPYSSLRDKTEQYRDKGIQPNQTSGVLWYQDIADYLDADELNFYLFRPAATDTLFMLMVSDFVETYAGLPRQRIAEEAVARVAAAIAAGPRGPVTYTWAAPYDDVPPACAVLTHELFADYAGEPDSGFVRETYSRGERSFSEYGKVLGLHVESTCVRRSAAKAVESWAGVGLEARVQTFRDQRQAERTLESYCTSTDTVDVDHKIGVATCLWRAGADYLMFNAGRYNVWLSVDRESQPTPEVLISNLIPIAEKIEGELR